MICTLALGIGANTAIFSVVDAVLLNPLPFTGGNRVVAIHEWVPKYGPMNDSWPDFVDWRSENDVFENMAAVQTAAVRLRLSSGIRMTRGLRVSKSFFSIFSLTPALGGTFTNDETKPGASPTVIASYDFWHDILGGNPDVIGSTIDVNNQLCTIVGVLPHNFKLPYGRFGLYLPLGIEEDMPGMANRSNHPGLSVIAKLRRGVSLSTARDEMDTIMSRLSRQYPKSDHNERVIVVPLLQQLVGKNADMLVLLLAATGCVLLLACANVAHISIAHSAARRREFAVRTALGATRSQLIYQRFIENLPVAVLAGAAALLILAGTLKPLIHMYPGHLYRLTDAHLGVFSFLFTTGIVVIVWIVVSLAPVVGISRIANLYASLKEGFVGGGPSGRRLRYILFTIEIAAALVLTIGGGLLLRSLVAATDVDPGFRSDHLILAHPLGSLLGVSPMRSEQLYSELITRVTQLPGVRSAGAAMTLPLGGTPWISPYMPSGYKPEPNTQHPWTALNVATPGYFRTMETQLIAGRFFSQSDDRKTAPVAIVNESLARTYPSADRIVGQSIYVPYCPHPVLRIVGVIHDMKEFGVGRPDMPQVYVPAAQLPLVNMSVAIRTSVDTDSIVRPIITVIQQVFKTGAVPHVSTMRAKLRSGLVGRRFTTLLVGLFTVLSLVLACVGVAGVIGCSVSERQREIAVRVALGARRGEVLWLVMRQAISPTCAGIAVGLLASYAFMRLLSSFLFGVKPHDPITFFAATAAVTVIAIVSAYLPARRALAVDPIKVLRYE